MNVSKSTFFYACLKRVSKNCLFVLIICSFCSSFVQEALTENKPKKKLHVVTTTGMLADTTRQLGGDLVDVESLMGPGVDPHLYQPTRTDLVKMKSADLIISNGLLLEGRFHEVLETLEEAGTPHLLAGEAVAKNDLLIPNIVDNSQTAEAYATKVYDPHIWMDPLLWKSVSAKISEILKKNSPKQELEYLEKNSLAYQKKLDDLYRLSKNLINTIPEKNRILVTAHDAFEYFGKRFNVEVKGIQGISTESEANLKQIEELVQLLVTKEIPAVFSEPSVSEKGVMSLIDGAKSKGHIVSLGGSLYSDSLGDFGTEQGTYLGMIKHNVMTITTALGGKVQK
jgi:manganese/zinc/iron transport system substrate-binding protein